MKIKLSFGFGLGLVLCGLILALWPWAIERDLAKVKESYLSSNGTQTFYDRRGELIHVESRQASDRRLPWVTLDSIPRHLIASLIRIEDRRFREHFGIDALALASAIRDRQGLGRLRGASTITMQLAGLLETSGPRTRSLLLKLKQMSGALFLEALWTKDEILEAYFNEVSFRHDLVGIGAAAQGLFQKEVHGLTEDEGIILITLLSSPNATIDRINRKACLLAKDGDACQRMQVLARKHLNGRARLAREESHAPHFVRQLRSSAKEVPTTLDKALQQKAQEWIYAQMQTLAPQNVKDAAAVVLDHRTGEILVYVGGSGRFSETREVDNVRALRQAGSTLKPFLYAKAIDDGIIHADTKLDDSAYQVQTPHGLYTPQNYDESFRGIVPVRIALASSLNIPAVRVIDLLSVDRFYRTLLDLGFTLSSRQTYGHSLALGAADVSLLQLVRAYAVLARGGRDLTPILQKAKPAKVLTHFSQETTKVIEDILSSRDTRAASFGLENALATPYRSAVKTGTSKDMRDNWCLGWDERYVVGVWLGNANGSPMWNVSGVSGAAPIWRALMDELQKDEFPSLDRSPNSAETVVPERPWPIVRNSRLGQITYPLDGTVIAFDPDIPEESQALIPEHTGRHDLKWMMNERPLWDGLIPLTELKPGRHSLELVDEKNKRVLDKVTFELRGKTASVSRSE